MSRQSRMLIIIGGMAILGVIALALVARKYQEYVPAGQGGNEVVQSVSNEMHNKLATFVRARNALKTSLDEAPYARDVLRDEMAGKETAQRPQSFDMVLLKAVMERRRVLRDYGMAYEEYAEIRDQYRAWRSDGDGLLQEWKQVFEQAEPDIIAAADLGEYDIMDQ